MQVDLLKIHLQVILQVDIGHVQPSPQGEGKNIQIPSAAFCDF